ncbi:MAG: GNAT family N-acetyltransferase [Bacteroidales bacterium]|jgi:ribosomal-protein-alanine N-acetyltransferase|nr:GNAT family N-acetyltransferase [Bacteroidales bacterium]
MLEIKELKSLEDFEKNNLSKDQFIDFLFKHLDRFGDPKPDIEACLDYAFSTNEAKGGFALAGFLDNEFVGALIMNKTGMSGYIPENILVYVAVDAEKRGHGIGGQIVKKSFELADGDVKLHVEYDNPAKRLYERCGMDTKYAEMRYKK